MGHLRLTRAPPACRLASFYGPSPTSSSVHAFLLPMSPLHWVLDQEPTPSELSAPCLIFQDASFSNPAKVGGGNRCFGVSRELGPC